MHASLNESYLNHGFFVVSLSLLRKDLMNLNLNEFKPIKLLLYLLKTVT